jgi:hypothetical protein
MALIFPEGFDYYANVSEIADGRKWTTAETVGNLSLVAGRIAGQAMRAGSWDAGISKTLASNYASGVVGFGARISNYGTWTTTKIGLCSFYNGVYLQVGVGVNSSGQLVVSRGLNQSIWQTTLATSSQNLIKNAWHYIEVKISIAESGGTVIVKVDGVEWINYTGDTCQSGEYFNIIKTGGCFYNVNTDIDDFYFCDLTGTKNNDFLGDCRVCTLYPDADTADADFVPDTGPDGYARIDGAIDDASYVESETVGHKSLFGYESLPATDIGDVAGVQIVTRAKKDDSGARSVSNVVASASSESVLTAYSLAEQFTHNADVLEDDPATGAAWTEGAVNAMLAGVEVAA